jgi:hypothetical protein
MDNDEIPLSGRIEDKIAWAQHRYKDFKKQLIHDKTIVTYLNNLECSIWAAHKEMKKVGILELCRGCEKNEGGSCCGKGLENKYDGWLLLINLLLNVPLPTSRHDPRSCFFLGENGCLLLARHVICVNYLCTTVTKHISPYKLSILREKEGAELEILFLLQERLKRVLRA